MDKLLETVMDKRAEIGLFNDVLGMLWGEMAWEEGADQMMVISYFGDIINYTTGRN
jgi:hypothetical protein